MYIQPQTNIRILRNVPLDTSYEHTLYFESASAQASYFISKQKYNLTGYTYQRVQRGTSRIGIKADSLYDCNYMMFQNTAYGSKWFYAFITSVEFVNNDCAEISFEIDVMQTWFFDYQLEHCFVEREHSVFDVIGAHIEPEPVEVGEYVFNEYKDISSVLNPMCVIVMVGDEDKAPSGTLYDGVYGGCTLHAYNVTDTDSIKKLLNTYAQKTDAIVGMYMCPVLATGEAIPTGGLTVKYTANAYTVTGSADILSADMNIDTYKPKNKKLYTYPYNFYSIGNGSSALNLRYEFFTGLQPSWKITIPITMPIECVLRPTHYKGSGDKTYNNETIALSNYPMCSWSTDAFKAWLAQNAIPIATNLLFDAGSLAGSAFTGNPYAGMQAGQSAFNHISSAVSDGYRASIKADIVKGTQNHGNNNVASGKQSFYGGRCSVTQEYARIIDDYFTMYGYATKRLKVPNTHSRPHWNFVKTSGCNVVGSVPADDMKKICGIYDNGITFWKNGDEVGNYSLDNSV